MAGGNFPPKFPIFGKNSDFLGIDKKSIWAKPELFRQRYEKFGQMQGF